jgi:5-methylcytosine-specific restriction endonuclease McrA
MELRICTCGNEFKAKTSPSRIGRGKFCSKECANKDKNADHIKPWCKHPELRYDLNNGRTLCVECYKKTPTYGAKTKTYQVGG